MELREFLAARKAIKNFVRLTELEQSHFLSDVCGGEVWLKLENLQLTGSFKPRGALNKLLRLSKKEISKGVVAASSGNHAQGLGYASRILGVNTTIVVPENTPKVKIDKIKRFPVKLIVHGGEYLEAERWARQIEMDNDLVFVSGYNDPQIIAGQGTISIEMKEEIPGLDAVVVPVGGGGLISGVGCAVKAIDEKVEVIGVQSVASPVMYESIRQGKIVEMELEDSIADGLHGGIEKRSITFNMCSEYVDDFILVEEEEILNAIRCMFLHQHQIVEGAGAVGVAAIMRNPEKFRSRKTGVVISGGNIEASLLRATIFQER